MVSVFLPVFFTIFMVIDPIGLVPLYIGLSSHIAPVKKKQIVRKAILLSFVILVIFVLLGERILALLHIEPGAFYIAGGIMLFVISMEMLFGRPTRSKVDPDQATDDEHDEGVSLAVFPLAIPMLAGPGALTAIILFTGSTEVDSLTMMFMLFAALILTLGAAWAILRASDLILKLLGRTGVSVFERIMGLLLSGLSVQFVYEGLIRLGVLPGVL
jgi:multiple antibiotic resistance protein